MTSLVAGLALVAVAAGASAQGASSEWTTPAGTPQGTRFSTLDQINTSNVGNLVEEFSWATGLRAGHQGQPLVVGSRMYVLTPFPNVLTALDLGNPGVVLWSYTPSNDSYSRVVACCDVVNRGAVYADGKIIFALLDTSVVAVDALTGQQVWRTTLGDPKRGETLTGAPIVAGNSVIVGNAGGELGVRGWVQGLDLRTGAPKWKAFNTGPDADVKIGASFQAFYAKDRGADLGSTSWPTGMWLRGGATSWGWFSYDPGLNLIYHGTGNPGVWNPDARPGDNQWGATLFARNPDTGEAAWAYQLTPHDGWDFDAVNENIVVDLPASDFQGAAARSTRSPRQVADTTTTRQVIVHFDKNGFAYTLDRRTGEVLVARKFGNVTWADRIDMATGAPVVNPGMAPHEGVVTQGICPSSLGTKDAEPAAYSPSTRLFYVPTLNFCTTLEPLRAQYIAGTPYTGASVSLVPGPGGFLGELVAWNAASGQRAWSIPEPLPLYGGALATAGNVVFYGTLDRWFKAVDARTGAELFKTKLECGIIGNPISYTAPDGKQRVAIYTGIGWLPGVFAGGPCPAGTNFVLSNGANPVRASPNLKAQVARMSMAIDQGPTSGMLHVFKLP